MSDVLCDYCDSVATIVTGKVVYPHRRDLYKLQFYYCDNNHEAAYVGCHKGTSTPLGRLANSELRRLKSKAHRSFDPLWKSGLMSRSEAYAWLAKELEIESRDCHIGMFNEVTCEIVDEICHEKLVELSSETYTSKDY